MNRTAKTLRVLAVAAALACAPLSAAATTRTAQDSAPRKAAPVRAAALTPDMQHIAAWAVHSRDHKGMPFIIIDKLNARAAAFDRKGKLVQSTPVLLGMGVGDRFPPELANVDMYQTTPAQRITPAGRYVAEEGINLERETVLWIDYDFGIALHRMPTKKTKQRRHERMLSPDPAQHRITYGCVNVPPAFYDRVVRPHFKGKGGIVYVLPDSAPLKSVFNSYDVDPAILNTAGGPRTTTGAVSPERF